MIATVSGRIVTRPPAIATRCVTSFSPTSTIRARPRSSKWVKETPGDSTVVRASSMFAPLSRRHRIAPGPLCGEGVACYDPPIARLMERRIPEMAKTVSATEARVHFGELLRGVTERGETYLVERSGTPLAVVIAVEEYERLRTSQDAIPDWERQLDELHDLIRRRHGDRAVPDAVELVNAGREERDAELLAALR
jgi:prevent-host-death family protein